MPDFYVAFSMCVVCSANEWTLLECACKKNDGVCSVLLP